MQEVTRKVGVAYIRIVVIQIRSTVQVLDAHRYRVALPQLYCRVNGMGVICIVVITTSTTRAHDIAVPQ